MKTSSKSVYNTKMKTKKTKNHTKIIKLITFIIVIAAAFAATAVWFTRPALAAWFDDTYSYRLKFTFTHNADIAAERSVTFTLDTAELIAASIMQSDCDDTRFTDGNGKPLLYDLTGTCNNAATTYEVIFPSIVNGTNLAYVYYGNPSAANAEIVSTSYTALTPSGGDPSNTAPTASDEQGPAPISYWNFDEAQGSTANDYSTGSNNDLTITNAVWKTGDLCVSGNCLYFDGSTSSGYLCFGIDAVAGTFPNDSACSTTSYADSKWHYVTAVKSTTSSITIYIDGAQIAQDASITATTIDGTNAPMTVGNDFDNGTNGWNGFIDEVKYYNFAKTVAQIAAEFASRGTAKGAAAQFGPDTNKSLSTGLVGWWKMDETDWTNDCSTNSITDSSGNGYSGKSCPSTTGPDPASAKFGNGGNFDGSNDYIDISTSFSVPSLEGTSSVWVYPTSATGYDILSAGVTTNDFRLSPVNNLYGFFISSEYRVSYATDPALNTWTLVTLTWDQKAGSILYFNGERVASNSSPPPTFNQTGLKIGSNTAGGEVITGKEDEVRFYNRALSPAEVSALYNWAPGPVGWWKLDENTGTSISDSSGNGNSMVMQGSLSSSDWSSCRYGSCLKFDGTNASAELDPSVTLFDDLPQLTATAWIYNTGDPTPGTTMRIVSNQKGGNNTGWHLAWDTFGRIRLDADYTTTDLISRHSALNANTWYFVAVTWDGTKTATTAVHLYVDGVEPAVYAQQQDAVGDRVSDASATQELAIGASPTSTGEFSGLIDDVRVYNYVRTPKQIIEDMNAGHPAGGSPISSPIIHWKMDEQNGSTLNNTNSQQSSLTGTTSSTGWRLENSASGGCKLNGCLDFNAQADSVTGGDPALFDSLTGMTLSFWINPQTLSVDDTIISKSDLSATNHSFLVRTDSTNSDEIRVYIGDNADSGDFYTTNNLDLTAAATYANWQQVTIVYEGTAAAADRVKVYKGGRVVGGSVTNTIPTSMDSASTTAFRLGDSDVTGSEGLITYMDEVKIYNFALSPSEILIDANAGSAAALGGVLGTHDSEGFGGDPPVGWWKMDENTGTSTTYDTSGNGRNGTLTNIENADWTPGKIGSTLQLDGSNKYIDIGTGPTSVKSIEFWVKPVTTTEYFVNLTSTTDYIWASSGTVTATGLTSPTIYVNGVVSSTISAGSWQHVVVTTGTAENASNLDIGRTQDANYLEGTIDNVRLYDYALSQAQVAWSFNRGVPVAWYKFDECSGATAYNAALNSNGQAAGMNGTITPGSLGNTTVGSCGSGTSTEMWNDGTTGKYNSALGFDGADDYITVTNSNPIDQNTGLVNGVTASAWIYANNAGEGTGGRILTKNAATWCRVDTLSGSNLDVQCSLDLATDATLNISAAVTTGTWNHVVMTWTNDADDEITIWVNGKNVGSSADGVGDPSADTANLIIGNDSTSGTATFDGLIDNVQIYPYEMTSAQIQRLYNEGSAVRFGPASGSP
ncbi:MAG: hypothetical protein UX99_C0023G0003 [Candidatus Amesbacteria bacterium GW2011_GWB1_47_26]|nr:MAG: hypothetical protein UX99_C0023G0003 [Candidatus Amesbacteria bacterium GW2011_GWB1_47_26]